MNSREHLAAEIDRGNTSLRRITWFVWAVAALVMTYGIFVSYGPLKNHGVPAHAAWMPSLAADAAMCIAIIAGPVLAAFNLTAGWIGTLRWGAALITWALQTSGPWLNNGGPNWAGVVLHSLPPLLLFLTAEGASSYTRKLGGALRGKRRELENAEQKDADRRAHLAELQAALNGRTVELNAAHAERQALTDQLAAAAENARTVEAQHTLVVDRLTTENRTLREALKPKPATSTATLNTFGATASTPGVPAPRRSVAVASTPAPNRKPISDEAAVQAMLNAHNDPNHEWSQNAVRTLTGAGWKRIERLIDLWRVEAARRSNSDPAGTSPLRTAAFPLPAQQPVATAVNGHPITEEN